MKAKRVRLTMLLLWATVGVIVACLGLFYFRFVSESVYHEAAEHLSEVYGQVNKNFDAFLECNWDNLYDWYESDRGVSEDRVRELMEERKAIWGFSSVFFLNDSGACRTADGKRGTYDLGEDAVLLFEGNERIMRNEERADGSDVTLFAIPVEGGTFDGFAYEAVALTYTNADMVAALDTDAFGGESTCLVVTPDGAVVLSTQAGASVFTNYLSYLKAGSDLTREQIEALSTAWKDRRSGVKRLTLGGENYYLSYQPCDYQDYVLIGVVKESVASQSLIEIQKATFDVLFKSFLLIAVVGLVQIVVSYRRRVRRSARAVNYRDTMFARLAANIDDIIFMLDGSTWQVDYVSPNMERLLGVPTEDVSADIHALAQTLFDEDVIIPTTDLHNLPFDHPTILERRHMHQKTGEVRWYREAVYHQHIGDEEKFIIVMSDRTDERKMNDSLQEALDTAKNANEAKSRFLSNMSHDIRTPMNAIMGFTALLAQNAGNPERVEDYVRKISSSGKHLLSLINDVLDMSKIESGKTSINAAPFNFRETIDELRTIILPQAEAKDQTMRFDIEGHTNEFLSGDKLRVNQILINLLSNAVKYTPVGGKIAFTVQELPRASHSRVDLRFIVEDNGIGMTPEFLATIFDPFTREINSTTNSIQGTGLGMAITKNLVDLMGGVIQIESTPHAGTTVTVDLSFGMPENFADEASEAGIDGLKAKPSFVASLQQAIASVGSDGEPAPAVAVQEDILKDMRFFAAEDNKLNAELLRDRLEWEGALVEIVGNGAEAVERLKTVEPGEVDIVLMDGEMPVMDGYEATRQIRKLENPVARKVPIIALTANVFSEDVKAALDAGMDAHLAKPLDMDELKMVVERLLRETRDEG